VKLIHFSSAPLAPVPVAVLLNMGHSCHCFYECHLSGILKAEIWPSDIKRIVDGIC
jgi:hypothetical protein